MTAVFGDPRLPGRFWAKVRLTDTCWNWTAARNSTGYGVFSLRGKRWGAHRIAAHTLIAPIPATLVVDHLCGNRRCVNPLHLRIVTQSENLRSGAGARLWRQHFSARTRCANGHEMTPENTYEFTKGTANCRACRICGRERNRAWRERRRVA